MGQYEAYSDRQSGIRFVFKRDPDDPSLLHIYARHLATVEDAIGAFFAGQTTWNEDRRRFETYSETHGLFWYWLEQETVVMVVTCFRRDDV